MFFRHVNRYAAIAAAILSCAIGADAAADPLRDKARSLFGSARAATQQEIDDPKARLGQALFFDSRLSSTGQMACATCHYAEAWGADSRRASVTARGTTTRQSQTVFHAQDANGLHWLADLASGADHAREAITGGMGFEKREQIVARMKELGYEKPFRAAWPGAGEAVTVDRYAEALEVYQRTLRTRSPFDAWLDGDDRAMTKKQVRGLRKFIDTGCVNCHVGPLVGGTMKQRFGLVERYPTDTGRPELDIGLMQNTGSERDRDVYRVPPLRNIARTPPYFHDGSVADLRKATEIMARVQLGRQLDDVTIGELVAFMESLTGPIPRNFHPPKGIPFVSPAAARAAR